MIPAVLAAEASSRDNFVDLEVSTGWWIGLAIAIFVLLGIFATRGPPPRVFIPITPTSFAKHSGTVSFWNER